jgi:hypothetical protein
MKDSAHRGIGDKYTSPGTHARHCPSIRLLAALGGMAMPQCERSNRCLLLLGGDRKLEYLAREGEQHAGVV